MIEGIPYEITEEEEREIRRAIKDDTEDIASLFKVLADSTRLQVLRALGVREVCVCVLVEVLGLQHSALSYHLKMLRDEGLVEAERQGSFQTYMLTRRGRKVLDALNALF